MSLCARSLIFRSLSRHICRGAEPLGVYLHQPGYARKVIMRYTTKREFFIHCALSVEEILSISTGWWRPRKPDAVANGYRRAVV